MSSCEVSLICRVPFPCVWYRPPSRGCASSAFCLRGSRGLRGHGGPAGAAQARHGGGAWLAGVTQAPPPTGSLETSDRASGVTSVYLACLTRLSPPYSSGLSVPFCTCPQSFNKHLAYQWQIFC